MHTGRFILSSFFIEYPSIKKNLSIELYQKLAVDNQRQCPRAASRAALIKGGKAKEWTVHPGANMNFEGPACSIAFFAWSRIIFVDTKGKRTWSKPAMSAKEVNFRASAIDGPPFKSAQEIACTG
jgi:hypothetical protein